MARRLPPSHSADEIIDDTFMAVWQHAADFRYQSQVSTWIFGIAYRVALNSLRRHKRWFVAFAGKSTEPVVDAHRQLEERDWLAEGLRRLPDNQRSSLLLIYQWGHSIEQVAAMAKCAAGTVKARSFSRSR